VAIPVSVVIIPVAIGTVPVPVAIVPVVTISITVAISVSVLVPVVVLLTSVRRRVGSGLAATVGTTLTNAHDHEVHAVILGSGVTYLDDSS
jgi:hypothetical protein